MRPGIGLCLAAVLLLVYATGPGTGLTSVPAPTTRARRSNDNTPLCPGNVDQVRVITMPDAQSTAMAQRLVDRLSPLFSPHRIQLFHAIHPESNNDASLLNRALWLEQEHVSDMQIFSLSILGAAISHHAVLRSVPENETWLVFEMDAVPDIQALTGVLVDLDTHPECLDQPLCGFDYLNLGVNHDYSDSAITTIDLSATKVRQCSINNPACHHLAAYAYVVTGRGARRLAEHMAPYGLPVDWYVTVFARLIDPTFTDGFVLPPPVGTKSQRGHDCLMCQLPHSNMGILLFVSGVIAAGILLGYLTTTYGRIGRTMVYDSMVTDMRFETTPTTYGPQKDSESVFSITGDEEQLDVDDSSMCRRA